MLNGQRPNALGAAALIYTLLAFSFVAIELAAAKPTSEDAGETRPQATAPATAADSNALSGKEEARLAELDAYWAKVSRAVKEGDFELYVSTCHKDGVIVSGIKKQCTPLSQALARWKQEFVDTKSGKRKSDVKFRFSQRLGDDTTAHETGIFLYTATDSQGTNVKEYIHFESLLLKRDGWKTMMEYQKSRATEEEWNALK